MNNKLKLKIQRFTPEVDIKPYYKSYEIFFSEGMTVLDALMKVKEEIDGTLSFRASCRMGICGSCGMIVNNKPLLACHTQIKELESFDLIVKPLCNYAVVKDLIVDLTKLFEKHKSIKPGLIHVQKPVAKAQFLQSPEELNSYLQFSYCIKCGICLAACPTCSTDENFLGPQAITQAYRYSVDSRDEGFKDRKNVVNRNHGIWHCHFAGACSIACPKGVDPALGIQKFKGLIVGNYFCKKSFIKALQDKVIDYTVKPIGETPKAPEKTVRKK
jgi:succinate dehydrogenase / fumarate reductase iron-sulfur subunit